MLIVDIRKYLIDSNCFITARNSYYNPNFCSQFWNALRLLHEKDILYSIDKVQKELLNGTEDDYCRINIAQDNFFDGMWLKTNSKISHN